VGWGPGRLGEGWGGHVAKVVAHGRGGCVCVGGGGSGPVRRAVLRSAAACVRWLQGSGVPHSGIGEAKITDRWGPSHCNGRRDQTLFESIQMVQFNSNIFKFVRSEQHLPLLGKNEIKYGFEGLVEVNNFLHRNFFIFEMSFELKI
jgi:hypothetical protein